LIGWQYTPLQQVHGRNTGYRQNDNYFFTLRFLKASFIIEALMNTKEGDVTMDLVSAAEFSADGPVKKDLMKTAGSNIVLVGLEAGR
jgi:hypothetical protein